ncbi:MAG: PP2C family protein-serine/threonine phosphatase [bacterium]
MKQQKTISSWILAGIALVSLVLGALIMPQINPYFASDPRVTRSEAKQVVEACLRQQGFDAGKFYYDAIFIYDASGLDYMMSAFGVAPIIALGREDRLPLSYWQFDFYQNVPKDQQRETMQVRVSPSGKLIGFIHTLPDSVAGDSLTATQGLQIAQQTLNNWPEIQPADFKLEQSSRTQKLRRTDAKLVFVRRDTSLKEAADVIEFYVSGTKLTSAVRYLRDPQDFIAASGVVGSANILINTLSVIVYIVLLFVSLVAFLRKYHEGEIGVRTGLSLAGIVFFMLVVGAINSWDRMALGTGFGAISQVYSKLIHFGVSAVFGYNFIALMVLGGWTVGEQVLRADHPRLLAGVDSLFNRRLLTKNIGRELPAGIAFGAIVFALVQIIYYVMIHALGAQPRISAVGGANFDHYLPVLTFTISLIFGGLFDEVVFRLWLIPSLRRKLNSAAAAITVSAFLYGLFLIFFNDTYSLRPAYLTFVPFFALGLMQGIVFWRYGLLAAMISMGVFSVLTQIGPFIASSSPFFLSNGLLALAVLAGLLVIGAIGKWRGEEFHFTPEDEPAHIRRIKERVRLQKELEIAHRVQLGLLPKTQPSVAGFDVAGVCIPALEVGGDYFDFVDLRDGNLGIAVGDVSGKGVPAAIYMTLTKGILQSHAGEETSPKKVLSKVNHLMYRTIERNWYVSMFYAVLDSKRRLLRFARAGHNPGIVFRTGESEARLLQTAGIGLGLDGGELFNKTLVEGELLLSPGDTLVLYTDGFTEAMDGHLQEFGEERFLDMLHRNKNGSSEELVHRIIESVKGFVGDQPQHDDMTLVVLKAV